VNIGLLECDHVAGRFPHIPGGYREAFGALLEPHMPKLRFTYFDACHGEVPAILAACDAYVCTGSQFSVYEPLDWIAPLQDFVLRLHQAKKPFVGICFGHQVLAQALGGEVRKADWGWGVGVHPMSFTRQEPWMQPPLETCRLQYMHQDQVAVPPPGSVVLARSEHCQIAMFRAGESMLGIEGHPEFSAAYSEALIRLRTERIGKQRAQQALASLRQPTDGVAVGKWIANFLRKNEIGL
jgi:GMP synthase-like glutamine amidotransferase